MNPIVSLFMFSCGDYEKVKQDVWEENWKAMRLYSVVALVALGLSRSLCKSFHRNLSILALMPSSHSSWLRTRAQPGWWHPSPHLEYSSFTRR